jgi:uncharacterized membrane protein YeaQ/YmgE (transglycosylase-associated protein family)
MDAPSDTLSARFSFATTSVRASTSHLLFTGDRRTGHGRGPGTTLAFRQGDMQRPRRRLHYSERMLLLGLILFGMVIGAAAQLILGRSAKGVDWTTALVSGLAGSFVGGLLISLLSGDGLEFRPSGIIGSLVGALIVTAAWQWWKHRAAKG